MIQNQMLSLQINPAANFRGTFTDTLFFSKKEKPLGKPQVIEIEHGKLRVNIPVQNILFIKAEHVYSRIFFSNDQRVLQRISLDKMLAKLPQDRFLRVHRSYIINLAHVRKFNSTKVLVGEKVIPIGRTWRDQVIPKLLEIKL
ncbi:MAG: LytTR family DNA-binding domain-containing protein [Bacteroidota bacterium]